MGENVSFFAHSHSSFLSAKTTKIFGFQKSILASKKQSFDAAGEDEKLNVHKKILQSSINVYEISIIDVFCVFHTQIDFSGILYSLTLNAILQKHSDGLSNSVLVTE